MTMTTKNTWSHSQPRHCHWKEDTKPVIHASMPPLPAHKVRRRAIWGGISRNRGTGKGRTHTVHGKASRCDIKQALNVSSFPSTRAPVKGRWNLVVVVCGDCDWNCAIARMQCRPVSDCRSAPSFFFRVVITILLGLRRHRETNLSCLMNQRDKSSRPFY